MDVYLSVLCVWSLVVSWLCSAVLSAPTATSPGPSTISWGPPLPTTSSSSSPEAPGASPGPPIGGPVSHAKRSRTKRCSCSTFLDKECVYFCHLDIIWVNTPERVVSYGLGNAPRTRRALRDPTGATGGGGGRTARCRCSHQGDAACHLFCGPGDTLRSQAPQDTGTRSPRRSAGTTARRTLQQAAAAAASL